MNEKNKKKRKRTIGNWAQTWVPWSGMMVKRTTSSSRRIQQILPRDARDAVNSTCKMHQSTTYN